MLEFGEASGNVYPVLVRSIVSLKQRTKSVLETSEVSASVVPVLVLQIQERGEVNKSLLRILQVGSEENKALTSTVPPFAINPVKAIVCGLEVTAKDWPFTSNVPELGGV